jgi:hypothetical protein
LLAGLDLTGCVVIADAMHTQRDHAEFLVQEKNAHYIFIVKKNQPGLYAQVKNLPWRQIPAGAGQRDRGHGREEHRTLTAATVAAGLAFPHAAQAIAVTRRIGSAAIGASRPCTTSATSPAARTAPRSAPAAAPRPWPPCGTWPSPS